MHRFYLVRLVFVRRYMYVSFGVTDPEVTLNVSCTWSCFNFSSGILHKDI